MVRRKLALASALVLASIGMLTGVPSFAAEPPSASSIATESQGLKFSYFEGASPAEIARRIRTNNSSEAIERYRYLSRVTGTVDPVVGPALNVGGVSPMAIGSAPISGYATNANRTWENKFVVAFLDCPLACTIVARVDFKFITNPGEFGRKTTWTGTRVGAAAATNVYVRSVVQKNLGVVSDHDQILNVTGSGTIWNSPHSGMLGARYRNWYYVTSTHPVYGFASYEYQTPSTRACVKPSGQAFKCLFP